MGEHDNTWSENSQIEPKKNTTTLWTEMDE